MSEPARLRARHLDHDLDILRAGGQRESPTLNESRAAQTSPTAAKARSALSDSQTAWKHPESAPAFWRRDQARCETLVHVLRLNRRKRSAARPHGWSAAR